MAGETHYEVLGVGFDADVRNVRRAYVHQARLHHPDFHVSDTPAVRAAAEARMRILNDAWAVLGDAARREKYDKELRNTGRYVVRSSSASPGATAPSASKRRSSPPPQRASGHSAPPRWITIAPPFTLMAAFGCFVVGFVTGLTAVLLAGFVLALVGAGLFLAAPVVALTRSKRDDVARGHVSGRDPRASSSPRKRRPA